jgi:hypothetical protein
MNESEAISRLRDAKEQFDGSDAVRNMAAAIREAQDPQGADMGDVAIAEELGVSPGWVHDLAS